MRDLFPQDWKPKLKRRLLGFDALVDSSLFRAARALRESYERFSTFMDGFHVAGWRRWLNELVSEGATMGAAGLVLMLALAMPAFRETLPTPNQGDGNGHAHTEIRIPTLRSSQPLR